jgi:hypothetical protein
MSWCSELSHGYSEAGDAHGGDIGVHAAACREYDIRICSVCCIIRDWLSLYNLVIIVVWPYGIECACDVSGPDPTPQSAVDEYGSARLHLRRLACMYLFSVHL